MSALVAAATATAALTPSSSADLLDLISSTRKRGVDPALDCSWRRLALQQAPNLLSARLYTTTTAKRLHDALELAQLCNESFVPPADAPSLPPWAAPAANITVFVSPMGDDAAKGTISAPMRTLHAALLRVRHSRAELPDLHASILLRAGTYRLASPLTLHHIDSYLTIEAYKREAAIIECSGLQVRILYLHVMPRMNPARPLNAVHVRAVAGASK